MKPHDYNLALTVDVKTGRWYVSVDDGDEIVKAWPDDSAQSRIEAERLLYDLENGRKAMP